MQYRDKDKAKCMSCSSNLASLKNGQLASPTQFNSSTDIPFVKGELPKIIPQWQFIDKPSPAFLKLMALLLSKEGDNGRY